MLDFLKKIKITYTVYNFFHKKQLKHNLAAYKALGMKKRYFSSVSSKDFKGLKTRIESVNDDENIRQNNCFADGHIQSRHSHWAAPMR